MRLLPFLKPTKGVQIAGGGFPDSGGGGGSYTLPPATASTLGGVKVGSGLSVTSDGTLSTSGGGGGSFDPTKQWVYHGSVDNSSPLSIQCPTNCFISIGDSYSLVLAYLCSNGGVYLIKEYADYTITYSNGTLNISTSAGAPRQVTIFCMELQP